MPVGVTADIEGSDEVILAGAKDGITRFNTRTGHHEYITKLWTEEEGLEKAKRYYRLPGAAFAETDAATDSGVMMARSIVRVDSGSGL